MFRGSKNFTRYWSVVVNKLFTTAWIKGRIRRMWIMMRSLLAFIGQGLQMFDVRIIMYSDTIKLHLSWKCGGNERKGNTVTDLSKTLAVCKLRGSILDDRPVRGGADTRLSYSCLKYLFKFILRFRCHQITCRKNKLLNLHSRHCKAEKFFVRSPGEKHYLLQRN